MDNATRPASPNQGTKGTVNKNEHKRAPWRKMGRIRNATRKTILALHLVQVLE